MKNFYCFIICFFTIVFLGCTPDKQEQEKLRQKAIQDSIALVESFKSPILKEFEKAHSNGTVILPTFLKIGCIADKIKSVYGINYFNFLLKFLSSYTEPTSILNLGKSYDIFAYQNHNNVDYCVNVSYNYINEILTVKISIGDCIINSDGRFVLDEKIKWQIRYLEHDEFGDPIKDKVFVSVYSDGNNYNSSTYIVVMKEDEEHVRFYYDLPWFPDTFDNNEIISIKIKNKNNGTVRKLSNYKYNTEYCILSEEDSNYIKSMCDSNPSISFCIRFEVINYDYYPDYSNTKVCTIDFDNGLAYGLSNAILAYFYKAF